MIKLENRDRPLSEAEWTQLAERWLAQNPAGLRVLLIPPDITRSHSYAGIITAWLYKQLAAQHEVSVMPAVGTHAQMTEEECAGFFPGVPFSSFLTHDWRSDCANLGTVPAGFVSQVTGGKYTHDIEIQVDRRLLSGEFDTILSIGQVVPHEVVGMANYTKNLVVGLGGREMINRTHMVSALCGVENIMGNTDTPVRAIFDYAQREYLDKLGVQFFLTVTKERDGEADLYGLYIGTERAAYEQAAALSAQLNINWLPKRVRRMVAFLDPSEFRTTWVGNKAVYRTRMAIEDSGELLVLAPGIHSFGENPEADKGIRAHGYAPYAEIFQKYYGHVFDGAEMIPAHLLQGSPDGRFKIIYATDPALMSKEEIEGVGFAWADVRELLPIYRPEERITGSYTLDGEEYYFVKAPATGLWRV